MHPSWIQEHGGSPGRIDSAASLSPELVFLTPGIPLVVDVCAKISRSLKEWVQGRAGAH